MERIITIDNLRGFAYCNDHICQKPIKGVAVSFSGLGGATMYAEDPEDGIRFAQEGILFVVPYQNPWAWQNKQNVAFTDEILDVLFEAYSLPEDLPVVFLLPVWRGDAGCLRLMIALIRTKCKVV